MMTALTAPQRRRGEIIDPKMKKAYIDLGHVNATVYSIDQLTNYVVVSFDKSVDISLQTKNGTADLYALAGSHICVRREDLSNHTMTVGTARNRSYIHLLSKVKFGAPLMYQLSAQHAQDYAYFDEDVEYEEPLFTHTSVNTDGEYSVVLATLTLAARNYE